MAVLATEPRVQDLLEARVVEPRVPTPDLLELRVPTQDRVEAGLVSPVVLAEQVAWVLTPVAGDAAPPPRHLEPMPKPPCGRHAGLGCHRLRALPHHHHHHHHRSRCPAAPLPALLPLPRELCPRCPLPRCCLCLRPLVNQEPPMLVQQRQQAPATTPRQHDPRVSTRTSPL